MQDIDDAVRVSALLSILMPPDQPAMFVLLISLLPRVLLTHMVGNQKLGCLKGGARMSRLYLGSFQLIV